MDVPVNKPQENRQISSSNDDILARRLKNRERQRRYRERKRLQADTNMVLGTNQLASPPIEVPVIVAPQDSVPQVNVPPQDMVLPVNVSLLDSAVPVKVVPQEYVMPVYVASGECIMPVSRASQDSVTTRVYSGRNWKSDARKAHVVRQKEVCFNGLVLPDLASTGGRQAPALPLVEQSDVAVRNVGSSPVTALGRNGTPKSILSRRHWKAEARNKKS